MRNSFHLVGAGRKCLTLLTLSVFLFTHSAFAALVVNNGNFSNLTGLTNGGGGWYHGIPNSWTTLSGTNYIIHTTGGAKLNLDHAGTVSQSLGTVVLGQEDVTISFDYGDVWGGGYYAANEDMITAELWDTTTNTLLASKTVKNTWAYGSLVSDSISTSSSATVGNTLEVRFTSLPGTGVTPGSAAALDNVAVTATDTTAPVTPSFVSPADNSFLTTAALDKIDWTDVTDSSSPVTYIYSSSFSATTNIDGSFAAPIYTSGALSTSEIATAGTPAGVYYVSVKAVDAVGNSSPWTTPIQITVDNTAPALSLPSNITQEATGPTGNVVTYVATSTDANPANPTVNCTPASGSTFPITTTTVNCTATDTAGNISNGSFTVTVQDTTAPVITLVGGAVNLTVGGAAYSEQGATVFDVVDTGLSATIDASAINPALPGSYMVTYNVTDTHGNAAITVNRVVNVSDVTGPVFFGVPADIVVEQVGTASAAVNYTAPTAVDDVDGPVTVLCGPLSGALFSYGTAAVLCSAQDSAVAPGPNVSTTSFNVTLQDTVVPTATSVSIASNNTNPTLAKEGDVITVSFTTSEPVNLPTATIAGKTATVTNTGGNNYTATYTLTATETQGVAAIAIDFDDIAGNDAAQVTAVTDASSVTIDTVAPVISNIASTPLFPPGSAITWTTSEATTSQVEYGLTTSYGSITTLDNTLVTSHTVNVTGLAAPETYHFLVVTADAAGNTVTSTVGGNTATTSNGGGAPFGSSGGLSFQITPTPNPTPTPAPTPNPTTTNPTPTSETNPTTPAPTPNPTTTNPTPTSETNPTTPAPTPTPNPATPINPENTNTTGDNSELIPTSFPNEAGTNTTGTTGGTTTGGTTTGGTGGGRATTGGTNTGSTFNPASATLDAGGGVTSEEPTVEPAPTVPQDIGGWAVPEEESHTLAWTLLGLVVLLNFAWFYTRKNSVPTR